MAKTGITVTGLKEQTARFAQYPQAFNIAEQKFLIAGLVILHENVRPYPPKPPKSTYIRTGMLGRSFGSGISGGQFGQPDIFMIGAKRGSIRSAKFGSRLKYAPDVVGEKTQKKTFRDIGWWTEFTIAKRAGPKIAKAAKIMVETLARFLDSKK